MRDRERQKSNGGSVRREHGSGVGKGGDRVVELDNHILSIFLAVLFVHLSYKPVMTLSVMIA